MRVNVLPPEALRLWLAIFFGLLSPVPVFAGPALLCTFQGLSVEQTLRFVAHASPYEAELIKINDHFQFRAVLLSTDGVTLDSVGLYTYYPTRGKSVLLHAVHHKAPFAIATDGGLDGTHRIYSPVYEREIRYSCKLEGRQP